LWRLQLEGVDVGDRMGHVADDWEARLAEEAGFYAFNDVHAAMALGMAGRDKAMDELASRMALAARGRDPGAAITAQVGVPLAQGIASFARGRYTDAIAAIAPVGALPVR